MQKRLPGKKQQYIPKQGDGAIAAGRVPRYSTTATNEFFTAGARSSQASFLEVTQATPIVGQSSNK